MNFIIIADKYNKGMKSKGCAGLLRVDKNLNLMQQQHDTIKKNFPKSRIVYVGGFESKKIENFLIQNYKDVIYVNNVDYENLNDGHSLSLVKNLLDQNTFIICGYTILEKNIFQSFSKELGNQIVVVPNHEKQIGCIINEGRIDNISFNLPNYIEDIYYITQKDIRILQDILKETKHKNYFVFELINRLIDLGVVFRPLFYHKKIKSKYYEYTN